MESHRYIYTLRLIFAVLGKRGSPKVSSYPMPRAGPGISFDKDILRGGAGSPNGINGLLIQVRDERVVLVVELVVRVEYDFVVGCVPFRHRRPPRPEAVHVGDDIAVVSPEVVRVDDGVGAPTRTS